MSLYCLVYTSIASQKMSDDDLKDLLKNKKKMKPDISLECSFISSLFSCRCWKARKQWLMSCLTLSNKIQDTTQGIAHL